MSSSVLLFFLPSISSTDCGFVDIPLRFQSHSEGRFLCEVVLRSGWDIRVHQVEVQVFSQVDMSCLHIYHSIHPGGTSKQFSDSYWLHHVFSSTCMRSPICRLTLAVLDSGFSSYGGSWSNANYYSRPAAKVLHWWCSTFAACQLPIKKRRNLQRQEKSKKNKLK